MGSEAGLPTILIVDDNIDDYEATIRGFKAAHLHNPVHWCTNGADALRYLRRDGSRDCPGVGGGAALVLLDLNMPGIDGRKVLEIAKGDPGLRKIPFVVLTTSRDEHDVERCYDLGASTYIQKPVNFDALVAAVVRIKDYWFGIALLPEGGACNRH